MLKEIGAGNRDENKECDLLSEDWIVDEVREICSI